MPTQDEGVDCKALASLAYSKRGIDTGELVIRGGSRLDFTRADATKVDCEDLRAGCAALSGDDGYPGDYSYATIDRSPDR